MTPAAGVASMPLDNWAYLRHLGIDYVPTERQYIFHNSGAKCRLYGGAVGGGKAVPTSTFIPTPSGWATMGDLAVGDFVLSETGPPTRVVWKSEILSQPTFRLTFSDGSTVVAGETHEWVTQTLAERERETRCADEFRAARRARRPLRGKGKRPDLAARNSRDAKSEPDPVIQGVRTTREILETLFARDGKQLNHSISMHAPVELPEATLPIDPYVLGAWLGDGTSADGSITGQDPEILSFVEAAGFPVTKRGRMRWGTRGLSRPLRLAGLLKNKHIPAAYLRASVTQRLALVQGLMDTDGYCDPRGKCEFTNTNHRLVDGMRELLLSLGIKATVCAGNATLDGRFISKKYRITFYSSLPVFRLERKLARQKREGFRGTHDRRYIVAVEEVERVPLQCIQVDSPTQCYLAGDGWVTTHNSKAIRMDAVCQCLLIPHWSAIILRRTFPELWGTQISKFIEDVPNKLYRWNEQKKIATFINGSTLRFGHVQHDKDVYDYKSEEFGGIYFDELTDFSFFVWSFMRLRNRSTTGGKSNIAGGTNPGGPGHEWVKKLWIERKPAPGMPADKYRADEYDFIPALLKDNPHLTEKDPEYAQTVADIPDPVLRAALQDGSWDIFAGQYFDIFSPDLHVLPRADVPTFETTPWYKRWISGDWGFKDPSLIHWHYQDENNRVVTYRELHVEGLTPAKLAEAIVEATPKEERPKIISFPFSPEAFGERTSQRTIADEMGEVLKEAGMPWPEQADNDRKGGWQLMYQMLDSGYWQISSACPELIEALPLMVRFDLPKDIEDIQPHQKDHAPDSVRYGLKSVVGRSRPPKDVELQRLLKKPLEEGDFQAALILRERFMDKDKKNRLAGRVLPHLAARRRGRFR